MDTTNSKSALVVGGTGPTGPHVINGLISRGYRVSVFHRGTHESDQIIEPVEHIHGDPHFAETIRDALGEQEYDLVVATYGRVRLLAQHFEGRTGRFIAVGSVSATRGHFSPESLFPAGLPVPTTEAEATAMEETGPDGRFAWRIASTEQDVLRSHPTGTVLRYPIIYGPHQVVPFEWSLIRRALDRRPFVVLPDGGLRLITRGYSQNMAHAVLCAVDRPEASRGKVYNCGDERQLTLHQLAEVVASAVGHEWEVLSVPGPLAWPAWPMIYTDPEGSWHRLYDTSALKNELGYHDVVPAVEAVTTTARWYADRRDELAEDIETRLKDPFDYAAEDRLSIDWRSSFEALMERHGRRAAERHHIYAHPQKPGLATDHRNR